jgi:hypothetical protein
MRVVSVVDPYRKCGPQRSAVFWKGHCIQRMPGCGLPGPSWGGSRRGFAARRDSDCRDPPLQPPHLVADLDHEIAVAFKLS